MNHYYFIENETGEEFLVNADTLSEARWVADDVAYEISVSNGTDRCHAEFQYEMTDDEAEASGLDEY